MRTAMTDKFNNSPDEETFIDEQENPSSDEPELVEEEENSKDKLKALRDKLKACEQEKMSHLEELQRVKADFLNARKRLEEDKEREKVRTLTNHIEKLLPLCDSFHMAMADKQAWAAAPETWRKGVEGIYAQLQSILAGYSVKALDPLSDPFDPALHEALTNVPVSDKNDHHKVMSVIQLGFIREENGSTLLIRPARVTVGEFQEEAESNEGG